MINIIEEFVCEAVKFVNSKVCETLIQTILPVMKKSVVLKSHQSNDSIHIENLGHIILKTAISIFLKNVGIERTERFERVKYLNSKPISRKILRIFWQICVPAATVYHSVSASVEKVSTNSSSHVSFNWGSWLWYAVESSASQLVAASCCVQCSHCV